MPHEDVEAWLQSWGTKRGPGMAAGSLKGTTEPLEGVKGSKNTPQKMPGATSAAINLPSMAEFDKLIAKAHIQGKKAGLKQSDITAAVAKAAAAGESNSRHSFHAPIHVCRYYSSHLNKSR